MALQIGQQFPTFSDIDGTPLTNGFVYIGTLNLNPETNQIACYWDAALTLPAAQPFRTIGGLIVRNGTPANIYVNATNYSITIRNKNSALVYSALSANNFINAEVMAAAIHAASTKATPIDADELPIADSAAAFGLKNLTWANLKATLLATWKDTTGGFVGLTLFKINFKNAANTFTSFLTNSNTAARTYTFQDRDGTIADLADVAAGSALVGIRGSYSNLAASAAGTGANVSISADELVVESAGNGYATLRAVSLTLNSAASGANGLDTGVLAGSTWYSLWVIWNGVTVASLMSASTTAPTMPVGYTHKARVGWIRTDGTANKFPLGFTQKGGFVQYLVAAGTNLTAAPMIATGVIGTFGSALVASAWANFFPPTVESFVIQMVVPASAACQYSPNASAGVTGTGGEGMVASVSGTVAMSCHIVPESGNIYFASNAAGGAFYAQKWKDNL